jgi:hypothetical protein
MSAEDDPARTIRPRLESADADLSRVHVLESIILPAAASEDQQQAGLPIERLPTVLAHDLVLLEATAAGLGDCRLIVIDPVSAYLEGVDDYRNTELRGVLSPLKALAERLNIGVMLVSHLAKSGGAHAKHRVIGSIAYVGACRANLMCIRDRTDRTEPTGRHVLLCDIGGNLAPTAPTLAYVIEDRGAGPRVEWLDEPVEITAEEALAAEIEAGHHPGQACERIEAARWLEEMLASGPALVKAIRQAAHDCGIAGRTLDRAKDDLRVESYREGYGKDGRWYWRLPGACIE